MHDLISFNWEKKTNKKIHEEDRKKAMYLLHKEKLKNKEKNE